MPTRHAVFAVVLAAGALLRIAVTLAYQPALVYYDSQEYLTNARHLVPEMLRPAGYPIFLRAVLGAGSLATIPVLQHVLGLLIGVLLYVLLLRLGVRPWLAALAAAPVLLDGFELDIEQFVLSETLFELLIVGACALLLWRRRASIALAAAAGALIALAAVTRSVGEALIAPALIAAAAPARGRPPWPALALLVGFAVPLAAYAAWYDSANGSYALTGAGGQFLYARVAPIADCSHLDLPAGERILCPPQPRGARPSPGKYMWSRRVSPLFRVPPERRNTLGGRFAKRVIRRQPLDYAKIVATDSLKSFAPAGMLGGNDAPEPWRFTADYPTYGYQTKNALHHYGYRHGRVRPQLARALRGYQGIVYAWGPLLAGCLLVALAALVRPRRPGLRRATFLFAAAGVAVLVGAAAANDFTWRYRLPLVVLLPPAAALALTAFRRA